MVWEGWDWNFEGQEGCRLATYIGLGWFGRDGIGTLKARKAVGWQPTEVQDG